MELDLLLTLIGMGASVVAAAAIARYQIRQLEQQMSELRKAMQANELRLDRNDMTTSMTEQRLNVIAQMNSPENKERQARELEGLRRDVDHLEQTIKKPPYSSLFNFWKTQPLFKTNPTCFTAPCFIPIQYS